ncbi:hypothetical protein [Micromonospora ureilytica]|uniref:hypothetical protein n=1 Tax=Micromonospora ureilytica TaxID=709868 RepID=UPI002E161809|nr:hypothetical protein OHB55_08010 [Micromonospora ureilytica]
MAIRHFREVQLIYFLLEILHELHPDARIEDDLRVAPNLRMDIVVFDEGAIHAIDVRGITPQTNERLEEVLAKLALYRHAIVNKYRVPRVELTLAVPGELTSEKVQLLRSAQVSLWDHQWILDAASKVGRLPAALEILKSASQRESTPSFESRQLRPWTFQQRLRAVPAGRPHWSQYQKLCKNIFEHLFCPPLSSPIEESSNESRVNRRDFVLPNYAPDGFWQFLRTHYRADYIVVDAKNLSGSLTKAHVLQICNYMTRHGTGLFGLLVTRKGSDKAADYTRREQWVLHGKLVITLNDDDMRQMLSNHDLGDDPAIVIRQKIEDFRLAI